MGEKSRREIRLISFWFFLQADLCCVENMRREYIRKGHDYKFIFTNISLPLNGPIRFKSPLAFSFWCSGESVILGYSTTSQHLKRYCPKLLARREARGRQTWNWIYFYSVHFSFLEFSFFFAKRKTTKRIVYCDCWPGKSVNTCVFRS